MRRLDRLVTQELKIDEQKAEISRLSERVATLTTALEFYANPFNRIDADGDKVSVPDFYDEMDFGRTAERALATPAPPTTQEELNQRVNMEHDSMAAVIEGKADGVTPNRQAKSEPESDAALLRYRELRKKTLHCPYCSMDYSNCGDCKKDREEAGQLEREYKFCPWGV